MSSAVLLSIKPEFALAIFSGEKRFEFRKTIYRDHSVSKVYVYASAPISKVIGEFQVEEVIEQHPKVLWQKTSHGAGITEEYFNEYFAGREIGYALKVTDVARFEESQDLEPMFGIRHPPQSFRYVSMHA
uniref:Predicted transcriptional regulator, contains an HTH and PUA-like domains n=1 Tax=Candidatus Kentrum sp. FW TaxID=2126338 RepID=A0A450RZP0_9GAMM|nr:MAG: Predicted transcriptional regulator, contains an HTH and PUA-like domains [Candidatus Kentron sp. FW]VFJ54211.1 MAG: Predicted transcriptional regulator, contains an HTH and PUA-like domains [Candidatus Kentron sp. FW]